MAESSIHSQVIITTKEEAKRFLNALIKSQQWIGENSQNEVGFIKITDKKEIEKIIKNFK